jgi:hypothetical protein
MSQGAFGIMPFTTDVDLWLDCEHGRIPLSQVGSTFVIASCPRQLPPCKAQVVVSIDGQVYPRAVRLVNGMRANQRRTLVLADDAIPF